MAAPMKPSEALRKARDLIFSPEKWTKGQAARDVDGNAVDELSVDAFCFCAYGAIWVYSPLGDPRTVSAEEYLEEAIGIADDPCHSIETWNDAPIRTHAEVLDAFRKAEKIALSEGN